MRHVAAEFFALTRAARAVLAAVGHGNPLTNGRGQNSLALVGGECALAGFNGDGECHTC